MASSSAKPPAQSRCPGLPAAALPAGCRQWRLPAIRRCACRRPPCRTAPRWRPAVAGGAAPACLRWRRSGRAPPTPGRRTGPRDLHEGDGLDNQERHRPVPQPPRGKPDGAEQSGKQVEGRREARARADPVELALVVVRAGAHEALHLGAAFCGQFSRLGLHGFVQGLFQRGLVHDISVPSMTVRRISCRVITPMSLPALLHHDGAVLVDCHLDQVAQGFDSFTRGEVGFTSLRRLPLLASGCMTAWARTTFSREIPATKSAT
jgi:hypothetical protein